jgi:hypothetical protein
VIVAGGSEQLVFTQEAVEGGLGEAARIEQSFLDAEPVQRHLVVLLALEVGLGGMKGFEQFFGRDLAGLAFVFAWLWRHAGDAVVLVAVEPGLDGAPGELA